MQYRKKPVVVEAVQFVPPNQIPDGVKFNMNNNRYEVYDKLHDTWVGLNPRDYIITGVQGETYPCKEDVFLSTYEAVDEA
ncbi:MAG TPA: hypothetical protein VM577_04540 [Anaerovoracaceae bacterium]|nr:hypothetical protein [Anaerovoracaceae bacterium]